MKRHIFFIGTLCNGGAERVVSILASHMAKQGIDVEILTYYDKPVSYMPDSRVKHTTVEKMTGTTNKVYNLFAIRRYFIKNAKVVISFLAPFNVMAIAANLGTGVPVIVADRNDPKKIPSNKCVRKVRDILYRFASGIVVQTQKNKAYFGKTVQKKTQVIYNPIDLKENAGIALKCKKEKKIVTAGRLMPQKNQKMMIQAFVNVLKKHPDYKLIIYGEGPKRQELECLCIESGVVESVFLPGNVTDIHEQMKDAKMFVLSSDYEGMPNALIEAMCLGLPVISTRVSGATDLIIDHQNGILTEINHQEQLEKAMMELIENKELEEKLARNAIKLNEDLEVSKIMRQWTDLIDTMILEK